MATTNKCSLQNLLADVLSVTGTEQSTWYPASIFSNHFNIVTSFLISEVVKIFPTNNQIVDIIEPFLKVTQLQIKKGGIELPDDFRDLLKVSVSVYPDYSGECGGKPIQQLIEKEFDDSIVKAQCETIDCNLVTQAQWGNLTRSTYKKPTYENPIVCLFGGRKIKICPFDIKNAEISYVRKEKVYVYGYTTQPDDTYVFDKNTSVESEWENAAYAPLFTGLSTLYSTYTSDPDAKDFSLILKQIGLV